jgi:hypothetical protein
MSFNIKNQQLTNWCGPLYVIGVFAGLAIFAGFVPPSSAFLSPEQVAAVYQNNTLGIRFGLFLAIAFSGLYAPFSAVISAQMRRIEKGRPVLSYIQLGNGVIGSLVLMMAFMFMMIAAFDPERPAEITAVINQFGWICLVIPFPPFCIQYIAIGMAILQDKSENPLFPRWVAFYNYWVALAFIPTGFVGFFKHGPFAWHGVIAFWLAITVYIIWFFVMFYALRAAINVAEEEGLQQQLQAL